MATGALDRAGSDRPALGEGCVVVELVEMAHQVAVAGVDGAALGGGQSLVVGLGGHLGRGAGGVACEDLG